MAHAIAAVSSPTARMTSTTTSVLSAQSATSFSVSPKPIPTLTARKSMIPLAATKKQARRRSMSVCTEG
ncbi:hypothetical protein ED92_10630 [Amycolatopsis sp. MJM2582]|nr:hypothetical protein ED92_10630 [Amycolatopsis sp. MJM2582]